MGKRAMGVVVLVLMLVAGAAAPAGAGSTHRGLLTDGGFEFPPLPRGEGTRFFRAGDHIGPWNVTSGIVAIVGAFARFETPPVGTQALRLLGVPSTDGGEICQPVVGMVAGATYKLRFLAASMIQESMVDVTLGGALVAHLDLPGTIPARFVRFRWTVRPTAAAESLCLRGDPIGENSFPLIDAIRIQRLPG